MSSPVLSALQGKEGQEVGVSAWFLIDQGRIDTFAPATSGSARSTGDAANATA